MKQVFPYAIKKIALLILIIGIFLPQLSQAQSTLTLDDCIDISLKNSKQLRIYEQKINAAKYKKKEAFGNYLPQLNANFNYTRLNEAPSMELPAAFGGGEVAVGSEENYLARLSLQQPLYMGGRIYQGNVQAKLNYELTRLEYDRIKEDLIFHLKQSFYGLILAQHFVNINQEAYDVIQAHLKVNEALYKEGKISNYDVSRVKVQLANARTNLLKAQNNLKLLKEALLNLIGFESMGIIEDVQIKGYLGYIEKPLEDFDYYINEALNRRIEIEQIDLQNKLNDSLIKIYKAGLLPSLVAVGNYDYEAEEWLDDFGRWKKNWSAVLTLNIPIFEGFITRAKVKQGYAQQEQINLTREQLIENIKLEVRQSYYNFQQAKENIKGQQENVDTAKDNLRIAQERYKLGLMSDIEVRDAQFALTQAETNYFQALYDYNIAQIGLDRATGKEENERGENKDG